MRLLDHSVLNSMEDHQKHIEKAVAILKEGGIVIFPTDTAYGIGCRIDDEKAIEKLFSIRRRPVTQATPVLVSGKEMAKRYILSLPERVERALMDEYWPGALTIILPARVERVPELVRGGTLTIGLRMPNHEIPLSIIERLGVPIIGTSANIHGNSTPYQLSDVDPVLFNLVDYIVPGVCSVKRESTVIDCVSDPWSIVRQGAIQL